MRPLFLFLALLNLGYFAWQWQQQSDEKPLSSGPIAVAPHSNTLTLLREIPGADAVGRKTNPQQEAPAAGTP